MDALRFSRDLRAKLADFVPVSDEQIAVLFEHYRLLLRWNEKINLTSLHDSEEILVRHYCECLFFARHLPARAGGAMLDLGSGAGFPGIPTAVYREDCNVTLCESDQRKAVFLREATRGLLNVSVAAHRAEALTGKYDWVVSRAVRSEKVLAVAAGLSCKVGLLIGAEDSGGVGQIGLGDSSGLPHRIKLPWGDRRFVVYG